jgi:hypothetical protein
MYFGNADEKRFACYKCKEELVFDVKIGRRDMCPNCSAYLHSCLNCEHHDKNVHNECKENQGEFIRDRSEGNFCLYFAFRTLDEGGRTVEDDAKARLNALFGGGAPAGAPTESAPVSREDAARAKLEDLFKK